MHVFVTGVPPATSRPPSSPSSWLTVTPSRAWHARTAQQAWSALGAEVRSGDLDDSDVLGSAARELDGVVHLAFNHDEQQSGNLAGAVVADLRPPEAIGIALEGSGKPLVGTSATGALALAGFDGELTEHDLLPAGLRIDAENLVVALGERDVWSSVVRLRPTVHGPGRFGFASDLVALARPPGFRATSETEPNRWPSVDAGDAARPYRLALESATAGARLHAVAEQGIALRDIDAVIGRRLDLPVEPISASEAGRHFGYLAAFVGLNNPTSGQVTRNTLGSTPRQPGLLIDLDDTPDLTDRGAG